MSNRVISACIIPAAGRGSRWAPISGYLPKEMLPLNDKPVIEWVIRETIASGCNHIIVVVSQQKKLIKDYISKNKEIKSKARISFVRQSKPLGIAHAMFLCKNLVGEGPFAVALPDLPTLSRKPVTKQLIQSFEKIKMEAHLVSFDKFSPETVHLYGECLIKPNKDKFLKIKHFCPKGKSPHHAGVRLRMSGRFIFKPEIFPIIEGLMKKQFAGEISDRTALNSALESGQRVVGVEILGHTYNTGYPEGYVRANTAFFKRLVRKRRVDV